jgi:hypothetical protein
VFSKLVVDQLQFKENIQTLPTNVHKFMQLGYLDLFEFRMSFFVEIENKSKMHSEREQLYNHIGEVDYGFLIH